MKTQRIIAFFLFLSRAACRLKPSPPDCLSGNQNFTTNMGSICTHCHLRSDVSLSSFVLSPFALQGEHKSRRVISWKKQTVKENELLVEAAQYARSGGGVPERFCGICANQTNSIKEFKKNWFSIFAQLTSDCRDSPCKYQWGCSGG